MRRAVVLFIWILMATTTSCIPISKITYLQESKSQDVDGLVNSRRLQPPYRLQVNDVVTITLTNSPEPQLEEYFSGNSGDATSGIAGLGYAVDLRGDVRLPEIGAVKAIGLTTDELQERIAAIILDKYVKDETELFLTVKLSGISYTMVGEVTGPGKNVVDREQVNIIEAIADSGGVPVTGDLTAVKIVRNYPDGVKVHKLDLTDLDVVYSPYYFIQPNDMIVVDPLPQKVIGTGTTGLSTFGTIVTVFSALATSVLLFTRL